MSQPYQAPIPYPQPAGAAAPLFQIRLLKHTGLLLAWQQQTLHYTGTLEQCEQYYNAAQQHCLLAGWWSLASSLLFNWIAIFSNAGAIKRVRNLARNPEAMAQQQAALADQQAAYAQQQAAYAQQQRAAGPPPAWYPDPSGQPGQRYWDGAKWTDFIHGPGHG